ncbi:MAG: aldo/keto reductase [Cytophagales bacterium]|nr:aldo/keto reductase [Cytophagales bacterium]MDW8383562.1 aldo/keto reductase [Flammeovirgaceae bacterium]
MQKVQLGNSDVNVSQIAFGAWAIGGWMWGGSDQKEAIRAIQKSIELGITTIDTAPIYGFGLSEELTAEALRGIPRDKVQILTKFGLRWDLQKGVFYFDSKMNDGQDVKIYKYSGKESVIYECEQSLRRLKTDYIDLYQIHWPDNSTPIEETFEAVSKLLEQGKIRAAGVCNYLPEQIERARTQVPIVSNQVPYSMVERTIEKYTVPYCIQHNISVLAYSPLQRGLLTGKIGMDYSFSEGDHRPHTKFFKPHNRSKILEFLELLRPFARKYQATISQIVLNWTLQQPGITCLLVGARNPQQVEENAQSLSFQLSSEEVIFIRNELEKLVILD